MADDKDSRDEQSRNADRRQRERDMIAAVERADEGEPAFPEDGLDALEAETAAVSFPATGSEVVAVVGDRELDGDGAVTARSLLPDTDVETFESPAAVRRRVERPTVALALKRVAEAAGTLRNTPYGRSQRDAYERTFEALVDVDEVDDDEGVRVLADWIVERIHETEQLPGSRDVRRRAAKYCRANGYPIRNDEWLGV